MARLKQHIVLGTEGDDLIDGTWPHRSSPNGAEIILGRGGNDAIFGLGGSDFIDAGSGNDTVKGGKGNDTYFGGSGSDRYVYDPGDGVDTLFETKNQPGVVDSVLITGTLIDLGWAFDGNDLLIYAPRDPLDVLDPANHIRVVNQYGPGSGGIEFFEADIGEENGFYTDQSVVPGGIARVYTPTGATGTDQGPYFELIVGTSKSDTLVGGGGFKDQFNAGAGHDRVIGSDETADRLFGGTGNDTLLGFGGNDRFRGQQGNDLMNGGDGNDHVQYIGVLTGSADAVHVDLNLQGVPQFISADQGWDTLISIENVTGSDFNDTLIGDEGGNFLAGGFDPPYPDGDDLILGRGGDDELAGADGNDTLDGGAGDDAMTGGAGDDLFIVDSEFDQVFEEPDEGIDTVRTAVSLFSPLAANVENLVLAPEFGFGFAAGNELANVMSVEGGVASFEGGLGNDTLVGGDPPPDSIPPNGDMLIGGEGDDLLIGGGGDDQLVGDASAVPLGGNNTLLGGTGDDILEGGFGNDSIEGGADDDLLLGDGFGAPIDGGKDTLVGGAGDDAMDAGAGDDVLICGDGNDGSGFFVFGVNGGDGSDFIDGGDGNDVLIGGSHEAADSDTLIGGAGNDVLEGGITAIGNSPDLLIDGTGSDRLQGFGGADLIELFDDGETDFIGGYNVAEDLGDVVTGFDPDAPGSIPEPDPTFPPAPLPPILGGDVLVFDGLPGLFSVEEAVDGGYLAFADSGNGGTNVLIDFDGNGDNLQTALTLEGVLFTSGIQDTLADNITFQPVILPNPMG